MSTDQPQVTADSRVLATHVDRFTILAVCTANICRSPLVELLLRQHLDTSAYEVGSAGIRGFRSRPMDLDAAKQAVHFGADPEYFKSRPLTADMATVSGLILTATREHRSNLLAVEPTALRRTFTLLEFAQLVRAYPADSLTELVALASRHRSSVTGPVDIEDPYRRGELVHQQVSEKIFDCVSEISVVLNRFAKAERAAAD